MFPLLHFKDQTPELHMILYLTTHRLELSHTATPAAKEVENKRVLQEYTCPAKILLLGKK